MRLLNFFSSGPLTSWLLVATGVATTAVPVLVQQHLEYEVRYFAYSAVVAELVGWAGWLVLDRRYPWWWRAVLNLLGGLTCVMAAACLIGGGHARRDLVACLLFGLVGAIPAWVVGLGFFTGRLISEPLQADPPRIKFTVTLRLCWGLLTACAYVAWLGRRLIVDTGGGWELDLGGESLLLLGLHGAEVACLAAPLGIVVWRAPRRWWVWLIYAAVFCAASPWIEPWLQHLFVKPIQHWDLPDSYLAIVGENLTWYGPQLLPTLWLFGLLRALSRREERNEHVPLDLAR